MSIIKINELNSITTVDSTNVLPIVDSNNETKKVSITQLKVKLTEDITNLHFLIVQTLPTTDIQTNIIYLVPKSPSGTNDIYDEYVYINNNWEKIGNKSIDLSDYYTKTQVDNLIPTIPTNISSFTNDVGYLTQHQDISGKEDKINKVTSISSSSTNTQYPSAKCVYDAINNALGNVLGGSY